MQAVAEAYRNLIATGARPLAATDNLNFGNPEKPEIMGQLVGCIRGIGAACLALDMPIVSGNVSLYNETDGRAILPTPTIGGVGLIENARADDPDGAARRRPAGAGRRDARASRAVGAACGDLRTRGRATRRRSIWRRSGRRASSCARRTRRGWSRRRTTSRTAAWRWRRRRWRWRAGSGWTLQADEALGAAAWFFGEDQGRYLLACAPEAVEATAGARRARPGSRCGRSGRPAAMRDPARERRGVGLDAVRRAHGRRCLAAASTDPCGPQGRL